MRLRSWFGAGLLLAPTGPAFAHATIEGVGDFYNGLLHPLLVPAHILVLVALGLLLGQQGGVHIRRGLPVFAALLAFGLLLSPQSPVRSIDIVLLACGVVTGVLIAAAYSQSILVTLGLCAISGAAIGLDSNPDTLPVLARFVTLTGTWIAACFVVLWFFGIADSFRRRWQQVGVRIAGSWIAAAAIMVIALDAWH